MTIAYSVKSVLKCYCVSLQPERRSAESMCFGVAGKDGFCFMTFCHGHLTITPVGVRCQENSCIFLEVNALVHPWQEICILNGPHVVPMKVHAHAVKAIVLEYYHHEWDPFGRCWLHDLYFSYSLHLFCDSSLTSSPD